MKLIKTSSCHINWVGDAILQSPPTCIRPSVVNILYLYASVTRLFKSQEPFANFVVHLSLIVTFLHSLFYYIVIPSVFVHLYAFALGGQTDWYPSCEGFLSTTFDLGQV